MNDLELDAWYAGLEQPSRNYVQTFATVQIALAFSEDAREKALVAEGELVAAMKRAERALDYLHRSNVTLEQAVRLHSRGRT